MMLRVDNVADRHVVGSVIVDGRVYSTEQICVPVENLLPRLRPGCRTVGAAFAEQLVDDLPTEDHDVRLDLVVTDG